MSGRGLGRKKAAGSLGGKKGQGSRLPAPGSAKGRTDLDAPLLVSAVKSTGLPAAIAAAAAETTTTTGSILPGLGLIDGQSPPVKISAV